MTGVSGCERRCSRLPPLHDFGLHFDLSFMSFSMAEHPFADILIIEQHIHLETGELLVTIASEMVNTALTSLSGGTSPRYMIRLASGPKVHAP